MMLNISIYSDEFHQYILISSILRKENKITLDMQN